MAKKQPGLMAEAEARAKAEFDKSTAEVRAYVEQFTTSRVSMALAAMLFLTFASTAFYSPTRLPNLASVNLAALGMAPPAPALDLSDFNVSAADQQKQLQQAAAQATPYAAKAYAAAKARFPALPLTLDIAGAALSLAAFLYTFKLQVRAARSAAKSPAL